jgi:CHAT domain-containing protein/Tfp pilus assembly protein PilF
MHPASVAAWVALATWAASPADSGHPGAVIVEEVQDGFAAHGAGLKPGDVLIGWERAASPPASPEPARGAFASPSDIPRVEEEQAPRGPLQVSVLRDAVQLLLKMPPGEWRLAVRPRMGGADLETYERARALVAADQHERGLALWGELARAWKGAGDARQASWLFLKVARAAVEKERWDAADAAFAEAEQGLPPADLVLIADLRGPCLEDRGEWDGAVALYREALEAQRKLAPESLGEARMLYLLGRMALRRGDLAAAEDHLRRALALREKLAPRSLKVASSVNALGIVAKDRGNLAAAEDYSRQALAMAEGLAPGGLEVAAALNSLGIVARRREDLASAEAYHRRALAITERLIPDSLGTASYLNNLGLVAEARGDLLAAEDHHRSSLAIKERLAPQSLSVSRSLTGLGKIAKERGDLAAAEDYHRRALVIAEKLAPQSGTVAMLLGNLGRVAEERGDLASAEDHARQALALQERVAPGSREVAGTLLNLGALAQRRGDLAGAVDQYKRGLAIAERVAPNSLELASFLNNLGLVAERRGDLVAAEAHHRRALAIKEKLSPDGLSTASSLANLGNMARQRGEPAAARYYLQRALAIHERLVPRGARTAATLQFLGELAAATGDPVAAEGWYQRALGLRRELAHGSTEEAETCHSLAILHRRTSRSAEALGFHRCAIDALEAQRSRLGSSDEVKSGFAAQHAHYYHHTIDLLVELGRSQEAFHVLERYRARGLLALLAERDLVFSTDLPAELDRERRVVNAEYDQVLRDLADAKGADAEKKREASNVLRRRQSALRDKIRASSPRLSALQYPEPLDLPATQAALDPGTVLLSYAIGETRSYVFAIGPGPHDFSAVPLDTDLKRLRGDVERFRRLLQQEILGWRQLRLVTRRLSATLLGPVAEPIARAQRLLLLPDGPLHLLPFAALDDPAPGRRRHLVEARPLHIAASATVFAEIKKGRRPEGERRLVAFGDPDYSSVAPLLKGGVSAPELRSAQQHGLELRPLPASRREVERIRGLFPGTSRVYVGSEATEERAATAGEGASLLHFACHALADEASPLDSSLALTMPAEWKPGQPNGLLQAWEIFEQVRLDADLVALSACGTGLGKEMSGEGVLGLTRAFQFAGARSVLASLWAVRDDSTAELMGRFYGHLKNGRSKDAALRAAQVEMIRQGWSFHPNRWAAFQLSGDWK